MENNYQPPSTTFATSPASSSQTNPQSKNTKNKEITPIHLLIMLSIFIAIVLIFITISQVFHTNPYGKQIKIDNLNQYYKNLPANTKDSVQNTLYNIVDDNNPDIEIPKSGAEIRSGSTNHHQNTTTNINTETFIVDIEKLQQSYVIQVSWSPDKKNPYIDNLGYPVLATCPSTEQLIYNPFNCIDAFSDNGVYNDPIIPILPIHISYYENNYSVYVAYDIISKVKDNQLTVIINDKTGGNYKAALDQLREKGINPDNYTIIYNDLSYELTPSRAPTNTFVTPPHPHYLDSP